MTKFSLVILLGVLLTASLMGCNTVKGAGKDVSNAGKGIEHAAQ